MRAPEFWKNDGLVSRLLSPFGAIYGAATAFHVARSGWRAPVPVICCGNAGVGGSGKTTLALDLACQLKLTGRRVAFITRGYGGKLRGPLRVNVQDAVEVGDEPLLLAKVAPCYLGRDRAAAARLAVSDGAELLIMDDGLQNPSLFRDVSILVIDGAVGFGNGRIIPAGPLRERVQDAAARCCVAVLIGDDATGALAHLPPNLPVVRADLIAAAGVANLRGRSLLAFAGIGRPAKFRETLEAAGLAVGALHAFPDHHRYTRAEILGLLARARDLDAVTVTTPKDFVRIPADLRILITEVGVRLQWHDQGVIRRVLATMQPV